VTIKVYIISDFFYFCCCLIVQVNDILIFIVLLPIEITKPTKYLPNQPLLSTVLLKLWWHVVKWLGEHAFLDNFNPWVPFGPWKMI